MEKVKKRGLFLLRPEDLTAIIDGLVKKLTNSPEKVETKSVSLSQLKTQGSAGDGSVKVQNKTKSPLSVFIEFEESGEEKPARSKPVIIPPGKTGSPRSVSVVIGLDRFTRTFDDKTTIIVTEEDRGKDPLGKTAHLNPGEMLRGPHPLYPNLMLYIARHR